jgi:chromosome segregation ATPase
MDTKPCKKRQSPACKGRNAQRIREYNSKKKLNVLLHRSETPKDKDVDELIQKVEAQHKMLFEKLTTANKEIAYLQKRLQQTQRRYYENLNNKESTLFELRDVIAAKQKQFDFCLHELREANMNVNQLEDDLAYAWSRIHRCETKIRHLLEELQTLRSNNIRTIPGQCHFYR